MKPITKQLVVAAFILISVTVLSLGIRQVRLGAHRAETRESTLSDPEDQLQSGQSLNTDVESGYYPDDSLTVDTESDPQYVNVSDFDEQAPSDDNSEAHTPTRLSKIKPSPRPNRSRATTPRPKGRKASRKYPWATSRISIEPKRASFGMSVNSPMAQPPRCKCRSMRPPARLPSSIWATMPSPKARKASKEYPWATIRISISPERASFGIQVNRPMVQAPRYNLKRTSPARSTLSTLLTVTIINEYSANGKERATKD